MSRKSVEYTRAALCVGLTVACRDQMEGNSAGAAELFQQSAQQWMFQGDARKAADSFDKAAAEVLLHLCCQLTSYINMYLLSL